MKSIECPWCGRNTYVLEYLEGPNHCRYCGKNVAPSRLALKLADVIFNLVQIKCKPYIQRLYPGHWQRSQGAWVWTMDSEDEYWSVGSQWPAKTVSKAKNLSYLNDIGSIDIIVEDPFV